MAIGSRIGIGRGIIMGIDVGISPGNGTGNSLDTGTGKSHFWTPQISAGQASLML